MEEEDGSVSRARTPPPRTLVKDRNVPICATLHRNAPTCTHGLGAAFVWRRAPSALADESRPQTHTLMGMDASPLMDAMQMVHHDAVVLHLVVMQKMQWWVPWLGLPQITRNVRQS